jgi:hypothetical protein
MSNIQEKKKKTNIYNGIYEEKKSKMCGMYSSYQ